MPIMSDADRKALAAWLAANAAGLDNDAAADLVNTPTLVDNPAPAVRPAAFDAETIESLLGPASLARFFALPLGPRIIDVLNAGVPTNAAKYAYALAAADPPAITTAERDAILARLQQTEPIPGWTKQVPGPTPWQNLFGDAPFTEVQAVDPAMGRSPEVTFRGHGTAAMVAEARS